MLNTNYDHNNHILKVLNRKIAKPVIYYALNIFDERVKKKRVLKSVLYFEPLDDFIKNLSEVLRGKTVHVISLVTVLCFLYISVVYFYN